MPLTACAALPTPRHSSAPNPAASIKSAQEKACAHTSAFVPAAATVPDASIDYSSVDELLQTIVLDGGPSLRKRAPLRNPKTGTLITYGHGSAFRLEGNKVLFSMFKDDHRARLKEELEYLIQVGNEVDVAVLPRAEQLAYWFNLHNLLVIATIAKHYPVRRPRAIELQPGVRLHDAPLVTLRDVRLSLRDIRSCVVFAQWRDPRVMYGFFNGELSSPRILLNAWTGPTLYEELDLSATEFINSLRGVGPRARHRLRRAANR